MSSNANLECRLCDKKMGHWHICRQHLLGKDHVSATKLAARDGKAKLVAELCEPLFREWNKKEGQAPLVKKARDDMYRRMGAAGSRQDAMDAVVVEEEYDAGAAVAVPASVAVAAAAVAAAAPDRKGAAVRRQFDCVALERVCRRG